MSKINKAIAYAVSLDGMPYRRWSLNMSSCLDMFYTDRLPAHQRIVQQGISCAGLINVMKLSIQIPLCVIPLHKSIPFGGTGYRFELLNTRQVLHSFDYRDFYPKGTLFLRKYRDEDDQGHVAVLKENVADKGLLHASIIHSYYLSPQYNGVASVELGVSHFSVSGGYYEYAVLPDDWLLR